MSSNYKFKMFGSKSTLFFNLKQAISFQILICYVNSNSYYR